MVHTRLKEPYREEKKKLHPGNHAGNLGFQKKLYWRQWLSCGILLDSTQDLMFWVFVFIGQFRNWTEVLPTYFNQLICFNAEMW